MKTTAFKISRCADCGDELEGASTVASLRSGCEMYIDRDCIYFVCDDCDIERQEALNLDDYEEGEDCRNGFFEPKFSAV